MATAEKNLDQFEGTPVPSGEDFKIAIIVSEWNSDITSSLLEGCKNTLLDNKVDEANILVHYVPGSFELPLGARFACKSLDVNAVICLGSVIQGETKHFDFVCQAVAQGVKDVSLATGIPVIFGVLTDNTMQQAKDRSGGKHGNKGTEAAVTALKMADLKRTIEKPSKRFSGFGH